MGLRTPMELTAEMEKFCADLDAGLVTDREAALFKTRCFFVAAKSHKNQIDAAKVLGRMARDKQHPLAAMAAGAEELLHDPTTKK